MSFRIIFATHRLPNKNKLFTQAFRQYSTENVVKRLVYTSPNATLVKFAKVFSLTTLSASAIATPSLLYFWDSPAVQAIDMTNTMFMGESLTRYVFSQMLFTAVAASACSTGALSFLLSPYINSIHLHTTAQYKDNDSPLPSISPNSVISIETIDILARRRTTTLRLRDLVPVNGSALMTWKVNKKILEKQYALEQTKDIKPTILQHRFWLDQRNGYGNRDAMVNILRIIQDQGQQRLI